MYRSTRFFSSRYTSACRNHKEHQNSTVLIDHNYGTLAVTRSNPKLPHIHAKLRSLAQEGERIEIIGHLAKEVVGDAEVVFYADVVVNCNRPRQ